MEKLAINGGVPVRQQSFPQWPVYGNKEKQLLDEVLKSRIWGFPGIENFVGPKVKELEEKFANFNGSSYAICCTNGTVSLEIALKTMEIGPGDEVIVPALTWVATAQAVLLVNAVPVFVDINPETYCIGSEEIEEAVTERTKAIIPVHLYGKVADMDAIMNIAKKYGLKVIEDCAHQHGSEWIGKKVGSIGDVGSFSLQSSKVMTSGEGGMITTDDKTIAQRCRSYVNVWNIYNEENLNTNKYAYFGSNARITEFQAAVLLAQLERLDEQIKKREGNAKYLSAELGKILGLEPLADNSKVTRQSYYVYVFKYKKEEFDGKSLKNFIKALRAEGIPGDHLYEPVYKSPMFGYDLKGCPLTCKFYGGEPVDYRKLNLPVAEKASYVEGVGLPQSVLLGGRKDMDDIVEAVEKIKAEAHSL